jgi:hypothetical protein
MRILQQRNGTVESYHPEPFPQDFAGWDYTAQVHQPVSVPDTWYVHEAFGGHHKNSVRRPQSALSAPCPSEPVNLIKAVELG